MVPGIVILHPNRRPYRTAVVGTVKPPRVAGPLEPSGDFPAFSPSRTFRPSCDVHARIQRSARLLPAVRRRTRKKGSLDRYGIPPFYATQQRSPGRSRDLARSRRASGPRHRFCQRTHEGFTAVIASLLRPSLQTRRGFCHPSCLSRNATRRVENQTSCFGIPGRSSVRRRLLNPHHCPAREGDARASGLDRQHFIPRRKNTTRTTAGRRRLTRT